MGKVEKTGSDGRIPYRVWVGVTGHRDLRDVEHLAALVKDALDRVRSWFPSTEATEVLLGVISPLAEGADRLVVREVLEDERSVLEVPLPRAENDYLNDFETIESKQEFEHLLAQAATVTTAPCFKTHQEGYAHAGQAVIERCDVLIALWDGKGQRGKGGTAEIVEKARPSVPILWIHTHQPREVEHTGVRNINRAEFEAFDRYNRAKIRDARLARVRAEAERELAKHEERSDALSQRAFADWVLPYFVRADLIALRYQRLFRRFLTVVLALTVAAVTTVAWGVAFSPDVHTYAWVEFVLLMVVGAIVVVGRHGRWHDRWIAARFLAERLRSAYFLAIAGVHRSPGDLERGTAGRAPAEPKDVPVRARVEWTARAYTEIWTRQPQFDVDEAGIPLVQSYLSSAWVGPQRAFHQDKRDHFESRHVWFERAVAALFVCTAAAALAHASGKLSHDSAGSHLLVVAAIFFPALAGALGAIDLEREYRRNAGRYAETAKRLRDVNEQLAEVGHVDDLRRLAQDVEKHMMRENRDWYAVMQFHDFELK